MLASSPVRKCQAPAVACASQYAMCARFFSAATSGVSRGSKLTSTTSKSSPGVNGTALSELEIPFITCEHSIGHCRYTNARTTGLSPEVVAQLHGTARARP